MNVQPELLTDIAFTKGSAAKSVRGEPVLPMLAEFGTFMASDVLPPLTDVLGLTSEFRPPRLVNAKDLSSEQRAEMGSATQDLSVQRRIAISGH